MSYARTTRLFLSFILVCWFLTAVHAGSLGRPLNLEDEGIFFVGGRPIVSSHPGVSPAGPVAPGTVIVDQMYVHYRIPSELRHEYPVVFVHGGGLTGASFETTPDGREGWATYFTRNGYAVYVVDTPGRGRSGFNASAINRAKMEGGDFDAPPVMLMVTVDLAWPLFRFGPSLGTAFPDSQFETSAMEQFGAQVVPFAEVTLEGGAMATAPKALAELLDRIGPSIVVVHSLSGPFADALVELRPDLVKAVINVEGAQNVTPTDDQIAAYGGIPTLELFGDYLEAPVFTAQPRLEARKLVVERINQVEDGQATLVRLPDIGIRGNSHMLMQDRNNLEIADYLLKWLDNNVR